MDIRAFRFFYTAHADTSDDFRIHPGPTVNLSYFLDDNQIVLAAWQMRHETAGQKLEFRISFNIRFYRHTLEEVCLIIGIFNDGQAAENGRFLQRHLAGLGNGLGQTVSMHGRTAIFFPEADGYHFDDAAFIGSRKIRMRFNPVADNDSIRFISIFIEIFPFLPDIPFPWTNG